MVRLLASAGVLTLVLVGCGSDPGSDGDPTPSVEDEPAPGPDEDPTTEAPDDPSEDADAGADAEDEPVDEPDDDVDVEDEPVDDLVDASIAPLCVDVDELVPSLADGVEPTGTTAEPQLDASVPEDEDADPGSITMVAAIQDWVAEHAAEDFAGLWVDRDLPGYAVAFADDVERHAEAIRAEVDPRLGVAEAPRSSEELEELEQRLVDDEWAPPTEDPADIVWVAGDLLMNRVIVALGERDDDRLAELSEEYGTSAICFEIWSEG